MSGILKSKWTAWAGLIISLVVIVLSFSLEDPWWSVIDIFFIFLAAFLHLNALYITKFNSFAARKLERIAFWCVVLSLVAFVGEYIAFHS